MMTLVGALWGIHGPVLKVAFQAGFTAPQLAIGEALVGVLVMGSCLLLSKTRWPRDRSFWLPLLAASLAGCGVPLGLFGSYALGPVAVGATLLFLYVPFAQVFLWIINRKPPDRFAWGASLLIVAGAALAADLTGTASRQNLPAAGLAILAALCFALYFVLMSRLGGQGTALQRSVVGSAVSTGAISLLCLGLGWPLIPAVEPVTGLGWLLLLGLVFHVMPILLLVQHGPKTGGSLGSILAASELPVAVTVAALFLKDPVSGFQAAGVVLVLCGIALPHLSRPRRVPSAEAEAALQPDQKRSG